MEILLTLSDEDVLAIEQDILPGVTVEDFVKGQVRAIIVAPRVEKYRAALVSTRLARYDRLSPADRAAVDVILNRVA